MITELIRTNRLCDECLAELQLDSATIDDLERFESLTNQRRKLERMLIWAVNKRLSENKNDFRINVLNSASPL